MPPVQPVRNLPGPSHQGVHPPPPISCVTMKLRGCISQSELSFSLRYIIALFMQQTILYSFGFDVCQ